MIPPTTHEATKQDVKKFWERNPLGLRESAEVTREVGTQSFFEHVEHRRYTREWHILSLVPFTSAQGKTVVEVGCGLGTDAIQWARAGADYIGFDLTHEAVALATERFRLLGLPGQFVNADAENLPLPSESADIVYSYGVLHHTPNTERAINEIYRVLRPGGMAIIMLYHRNSIQMLQIFLQALAFYSLRFDLGVQSVHLLTRKPLDRLRAHQKYLRREPAFFMDGALARYVDGWETPITRAYSRSQAYELFCDFRNVQLRTCAVFQLEGLRSLVGPTITNTAEDLIGRILGLGWHMFIFTRK